ncbi:MAGUK p55 subfamily member 6-like isoform X3 [Labeo rohita]|uniref:MAGUK p55 subfamily member 6-like isoform X3 n=1 Tax=Labeo rohita TaxID=84645 RepID=A0A498NY25_LABRO|nr:MAGUK p55 subfamily member 6-like isoform X3 [Labeo rohita]
MESPIVRSLAKAHERLEDVKLEAVQENNVELVTEILGDISGLSVRDDSAAELSKILQEPHFQAHERLEDVKLEAVQENNVELVTEILGDISGLSVRDDSAAELSKILQEPHFQSLLEAHDMVASKCYEAPPPPEVTNDAAVNNALMQADAVRMIGIRRKQENLWYVFVNIQICM